ncbi:MAG: DNA-binding NarL/FixJ family response regulator [Saprospiraceae bacterium]|jgi:DNA-binding NarL/FixJ family response regulator
MASRSTVLILSDVYLFQEGIKVLLGDSGLYEEVLLTDDPKEFENMLQKHAPQLVVLDMQSSVFRAEKVLAFVDFTTKSNMLLFSDKLTKKECDQFIERGAKGLLHKFSSKSTIMRGLQQVYEDMLFLDESICSDEGIDDSMVTQFKISIREKEIIKLIAQGLINKEIADKLFISTHTVNTHRKNIMAKLSINNTAGIVLFAVKEGIVSPDEFLFI